jgi:hypothetical protein
MVRKSGSGEPGMIAWNGVGQPAVSRATFHVLVNVE